MEARSADHHPNSETTYGRHQDARNSFTGAARRGRKSDFLLGELIARSEEIQPQTDYMHSRLRSSWLLSSAATGKTFRGLWSSWSNFPLK